MSPLVSVIIPAWNAQHYIEHAVRSVLSQSLESFEIIIVDDGSTDETRRVITSIRDPRVFLCVNDSNLGPAYSRNLGIAKSTGEWIAILDADDWWERDRLKRLIELARDTGADVVCDDLYISSNPFTRPSTTYLQSRRSVTLSAKTPSTITLLSMAREDHGYLKPVIRRSFMQKTGVKYREELRYSEDFLFFMDILLAGGQMIFVPEPMYYYRQTEGSLSRKNLSAMYGFQVNALENWTRENANRLPKPVLRALHHLILHKKTCVNVEEIVGRWLCGERTAAVLEGLRHPRAVIKLVKNRL
jgi:succinoglycan biosynthesis protein ExoO